MRFQLLTALSSLAMVGSAALAQAPAPAPAAPPVAATTPAVPPKAGDQRRLFISPMGEPFRNGDSAEVLAAAWFVGADTDRDGKLTLKEFTADERRFFATLDTNHDGEIAPDEIDHYENVLVPEIRMAFNMGMGMKVSTKFDGENWSPTVDEKDAVAPIIQRREGAGRFGYIDVREPVTSADSDLNRGVSAEEFDAAAKKRFQLLDPDHHGYLTLAGMPELSKANARRGGNGGGDRERRESGSRRERRGGGAGGGF